MNELKAEHPMLDIFKENGSLRITTIILDKLNQKKNVIGSASIQKSV